MVSTKYLIIIFAIVFCSQQACSFKIKIKPLKIIYYIAKIIIHWNDDPPEDPYRSHIGPFSEGRPDDESGKYVYQSVVMAMPKVLESIKNKNDTELMNYYYDTYYNRERPFYFFFLNDEQWSWWRKKELEGRVMANKLMTMYTAFEKESNGVSKPGYLSRFAQCFTAFFTVYIWILSQVPDMTPHN